jgi:hypothetical protein
LQQGLAGHAVFLGQHFFSGQHFGFGHSTFLAQHFFTQGVWGAGAGSCALSTPQQNAAASRLRANFFIVIFPFYLSLVDARL